MWYCCLYSIWLIPNRLHELIIGTGVDSTSQFRGHSRTGGQQVDLSSTFWKVNYDAKS